MNTCITNPFPFDVDWSVVQAVNGFIEPLWSYTGSWNQSNVLKPYQGYYFDNQNALDNFSIPYVASLGKRLINIQIDWQVTISLNCQGIEESSTIFGVSQQAVGQQAETGTETYDALSHALCLVCLTPADPGVLPWG